MENACWVKFPVKPQKTQHVPEPYHCSRVESKQSGPDAVIGADIGVKNHSIQG
jgi:hypothetical protein